MLTIKCRLHLAAAFLIFATAAGAQDKVSSGIPHIVITQEEIKRQNIRKLDQLFDGQIPGMISIDRGASQTTTLYGRGYSSIDYLALPRIYLDGVPLAFVSSLAFVSVETVDSVVAETGAAAGTLTGSGASGGVVHIYTKRGKVDSKPSISGKVVGGLDQSLYGKGNKLFQDHTVELEGGRKPFTYYGGAGYGSEGEWAPSYSNRIMHANGNVTGYSRYGSFTAHLRWNDNTTDEPDERFGSNTYPQHRSDDVNTLLYGITATGNLTKWWQHELSFGIHNQDTESKQSDPILETSDDTLLLNYRIQYERTSLVYRTSVDLPKYGIFAPRLSAGYDQSDLVSKLDLSLAAPDGTFLAGSSTRTKAKWQGYYARLGLLVGNNLALNAGARKDTRDGGVNPKVNDPKFRPRYDAAYTIQNLWTKDSRLVLRAAYGEVANPQGSDDAEITTSSTYGSYFSILPNPGLKPEVLQGTEVGFDFNLRATRLSATFFDQKGRGGQALVLADSVRSLSPPYTYAYQYQDQNVIDIRNRGLSASLRTAAGPVALAADYTAFHSKDDKVSSAVTGYTPRSSINYYPTQNGHASLRYANKLGSASVDARYLGSYRGANYITLTTVTYPAFATYDLNVSKPIDRFGTFILFVHNLANTEKYGYDNSDYVYGRRVGLGLRFNLDDMLH